jgi:hypothetical protein
LLAVHLYYVDGVGIVLFAGLLGRLWHLYWALRKEKGHAFLASSVVIILFWVPLLFLTVGRMAFVARNDSLEGPGGRVSPLAFLLGLFIEKLFFSLSMAPTSAIVGLVRRELPFLPARA